MTSAVHGKMARGAVLMVLVKLVERGIGLISTLILARLLLPADFGVIAMALSFVVMAELLMAFGFDVAIIQNQSATEEHFHSAWTCNLLLGLFVTLLMLALAAPIADFYRRPELVWVVCALAFGPLLAGAENIGVVAFRKELDFRREFKFQLTRKLIGFAIVVPLAFMLRSYWALVAGILFSKFAGVVISYRMHPFRPRFGLSRARELIGFSRWLLVNNLVGFLKEHSSVFFVGRLLGPASLGSYTIAYELASLPTTEISAPINRALLPGFAKFTTTAEVAVAYATALGVMALLALPAAAGIMALAPFLVPVVLGTTWLEAVPLMEVFAFNGALLMFHSSICAVLIGRGYPGRTTFANGCYAAILVASLAVVLLHFSSYGSRAAAYAVLLTTVLSTPIYLFQVRHCLGIPPGTFAKAIVRPLLASAGMVMLIRWSLPAYAPEMSGLTTLSWLCAGLAIGALGYLAMLLGLWHATGRPEGAERLLLERARALWSARFGIARGMRVE